VILVVAAVALAESVAMDHPLVVVQAAQVAQGFHHP
jgi:hypothetical protein